MQTARRRLLRALLCPRPPPSSSSPITTLARGASEPLNRALDGSLPRATFGAPWAAIQTRGAKVLKAQHTQHGRGGATIQVELRDVDNGNKVTERFRTDEAIERVFVEEKSFTYLYQEGDSVALMEPSTFEQLEVPKELFGKAAGYLKGCAMFMLGGLWHGSMPSNDIQLIFVPMLELLGILLSRVSGRNESGNGVGWDETFAIPSVGTWGIPFYAVMALPMMKQHNEISFLSIYKARKMHWKQTEQFTSFDQKESCYHVVAIMDLFFAFHDDMTVTLQYYDGKPMSASVPQRVTCTVAEAQPYTKGLTAAPQYKRVVLDNGLTVHVSGSFYFSILLELPVH
ncbi:hypothetical protein COCNU_06G014240 [Cocos nucifera]|uniref:Translation elongation factor P/YeiP central domain-containing protein n=1 Tax=Cocos nucifera TaxID=13894 RepID=A0A8K0ICQ2_COCNU|nr:hypothetical protein COCNU_06G014240 [Cocos nucifera]